MKYLLLTAAALIMVTGSQAALVALPNGDFEATTANAFPGGFDIGGNDVPNWTNLTPINDSGVENNSAWWGTYAGYSAFLEGGEGAYAMSSSYIIQAGDEFTLEIIAKNWGGGSPTATATLFFDTPANVIGTYSFTASGAYAAYSNSTPIVATGASVGGLLGISILNTSAPATFNAYLNFDNVSINAVPEPSAALLGGLSVLGLLRRRRAR